MSRFSEHYEKPESHLSGILIEAKVKTKSKSIRKEVLKRLINFFGKKSEKVDTSKIGEISKITKTGFNELANKLSNNLLSKTKQDDNYYIKSILAGKINNPKDIDPNWQSTQSSTIFKANNGGKVYLFSIKDKDGSIMHYVAGNDKIDRWFTDKMGKTYSLFVASKLTDHKKKRKSYDINLDEPDEKIPTDEPITTTPKANTDTDLPKLGFLDIDGTDFDGMVDMWGDGRVGYGLYKKSYKYKGAIKRKAFSNNWGTGYEYTFPTGDTIHLIQSNTNADNALVVFDGRDSISKAKQLRMVPWLKPGTKLYWKNTDINNMEE